MKRCLVLLWLATLGLCGILAVDVSESASQPALAAGRPDQPLIGALVVSSLEIADEGDPLLRAKGSATAAQALADAAQRAAKRGDSAQAGKLKVWLTKVLDQGVRYNVETVDPAGLEGARKALWLELNDRPEAITRALESGLQSLNPPLNQGRTDADSKERDREKFKGKGKDKGKGKGPPPWGDDFKGKGKGPPPWGDDFKGWDKKGKKDQVYLAPGSHAHGLAWAGIRPWLLQHAHA